MKISIVTVCLNTAATIAATFESVFAQTYLDYELVVIDGGSTDGTREIIDHYRKRIAYYVSEKDHGIYHAMNKGVRAASGDFLLFLNANDTLYAPDVLERVAAAAATYPQARLLFGNANVVPDDGSPAWIKDNSQATDKFFFFYNSTSHQATFYHRELFTTVGLYNENWRIISDWEYSVRCLCEHRVPALYLPFVVANFTLGGVSCQKEHLRAHFRERAAGQKLHFGSYYPFLRADVFLKKNFNSLYKHLRHTQVFQSIVRKYRERERLRNIRGA